MMQRLRSALQRLLRLFQPRSRRKPLEMAVHPASVLPEHPPLPDDRGDSETELRVCTRAESSAFPVAAYLSGIRSGPVSAAEWGHICSESGEITAAWLSEVTGLRFEAEPPSTVIVHARPRGRQGA